MPDLNELLKWSILNTNTEQAQPEEQDQQLSLRFNPTSSSSPSSALHPSDPQYRRNATSAEDGGEAPVDPTTGAELPAPLPRGVRSVQESNDILEMLMGKPDSTTMKEKMAFAENEENDVDQRVEALDDFEMLIESIDNANNLVVLKMWEPLLALLQSKDDPIVAHAAWIIGTSVQNNLTAQAAFFAHNALEPILQLTTSPSRPTSVRAKAVYALSSSLKHWPLATSALGASSSAGYKALSSLVHDPERVIRRKAAFLLSTLVMQSGEKYEGDIPKAVVELIQQQTNSPSAESSETLLDGLKKEGVLSSLLDALKSRGGDVEFEENAFRGLSRAVEKGGLEMEQVKELKGIWEAWGAEGRAERGLDGQDGEDIDKVLA